MPDDIEDFLSDLGLDEFYPGSKTKRRGPSQVAVRTTSSPAGAWDEQPFMKFMGGKQVEMFTIGALAKALERPVVTIRLWTRKGYIPQAPYRLPDKVLEGGTKQKGRRLYTRALIEATVEAFQNRGLIGSARVEWSRHRDLSIELLEKWTKIHDQETSR